MPSSAEHYQSLLQLLQEAELLGSCSHVLSWDEQTHMPSGGAEHRANQLGLLAGLSHERRTSPRIGELLQELTAKGLSDDPADDQSVIIREAQRTYDRATKLPRVLVEELSRTTSLSQQHWVTARRESNFQKFLPWLSKLVQLKREEAAAIGSTTGVAYDALLDEFEPGMTAAQLQQAFGPLRDALVPLVAAIQGSSRRAPLEIIERTYPKQGQRQLAELAAHKIGFDFTCGRLDESAHPFCSGIGPGDCRLTTRYQERHFNSAFFGVLHEAGHGIYEQGVPGAAFGTALGQTCSLGIHESQSRLWENLIGRSREFWLHFYPQAQEFFPEALSQVSPDDFYFAINDVRPSFIRVEADEVTYNLHIMLRFELEQQLLSGALDPADVPTAWNEAFQRYFSLTPANDAQGCLQDIHWSAGLMGYFPTYALGNMFASQFLEAAANDIPNLKEQIASGEFADLKNWLNVNIHQHGKRYSAPELVKVVTGKPLSHDPLVRHLQSKFAPLYGL